MVADGKHLTADDETTSRGTTTAGPRDNVIFELGLFIGALGSARTFDLRPRGADMKVPSDLLGVTPLTYDTISDLDVSLGPVVTQVQGIIEQIGPK